MSNEGCKTCGTRRYALKAKNQCRRCYEIGRRIFRVQAWELKDKRTPIGAFSISRFTEPQFTLFKSDIVSQLESRLQHFKWVEQMLAGPVQPIDIEDQLQRIADKAAPGNRNLFFNKAGYISDHFERQQLNVIFKLLNEIEEQIPWKGIDLAQAYDVAIGRNQCNPPNCIA